MKSRRNVFLWKVSTSFDEEMTIFSTSLIKLICIRVMSTNYNIIWYSTAAAAAAKLLQSCLTLCDPTDGSPPGSPVPGILQARTLEWVAISFSSAWKWKVKVKSFSHVRLLATPWTIAHQAPPSMGFSRQEHWSGVPLPSPKMKYYTVIKINEVDRSILTWINHMKLYFQGGI